MGCGCNKKQGNLPRARVPSSARKFVKRNPSQESSRKIRGPVPRRPGRKSR